VCIVLKSKITVYWKRTGKGNRSRGWWRWEIQRSKNEISISIFLCSLRWQRETELSVSCAHRHSLTDKNKAFLLLFFITRYQNLFRRSRPCFASQQQARFPPFFSQSALFALALNPILMAAFQRFSLSFKEEYIRREKTRRNVFFSFSSFFFGCYNGHLALLSILQTPYQMQLPSRTRVKAVKRHLLSISMTPVGR